MGTGEMMWWLKALDQGPEFNSQHSQDGSQLAVNSAPRGI